MDKIKQYNAKLRNYNFKTIIEYISLHPIINKNDGFKIKDISILSTDLYPDNQATRRGLIKDSATYCQNKKGRKTISSKEFNQICILRNECYPIDNGSFKSGEGIASLFAITKQQVGVGYSDSLSPHFERDYYIFTEIDKKLKSEPNKYLNSFNYYNTLFETKPLNGFLTILLFYRETIMNNKKIIEKPFTSFEYFVLKILEKEITYIHGKTEKYNYLVHCLIRIGEKYYIPSYSFLYNRLSNIFYWSFRNYCYFEFKNDFFPIRFGYYFEEYVNQYLEYTIGLDSFSRLDKIIDNNLKRPDFNIKKADFEFYVECKSRLIFLEDIDKKILTGIFKDEIIDGLKQLMNFDKDNKSAIRIILLYEDSFPLLSFFENDLRNQLNLDENYILCTIDEFEALFDLKSNNDFRNVIRFLLNSKSKGDNVTISDSLVKNNVGRLFSNFHLNYVEKAIYDNENELVKFWNSILSQKSQ